MAQGLFINNSITPDRLGAVNGLGVTVTSLFRYVTYDHNIESWANGHQLLLKSHQSVCLSISVLIPSCCAVSWSAHHSGLLLKVLAYFCVCSLQHIQVLWAEFITTEQTFQVIVCLTIMQEVVGLNPGCGIPFCFFVTILFRCTY